MKRASLLFVLVPLSLSAAPAAPSLDSLFPKRASISTGAEPGLARVALPPEVLRLAQPDLSDVRVLDATGAEIPYLVDEGGRQVEDAPLTRLPVLLDFARDEQRTDLGPTTYRERFVIAVPEDPASGPWSLDILPAKAEFVARARVRLRSGGTFADAPLFRLPNLPRARTEIPLPGGPSAREVEVVVESQETFLAPALALRARGARHPASELEVALAVVGETRANGVSTYVLERPAGLVPGSIRVTTPTPWIDRQIEAWDEGAGRSDTLLGSGRLVKIEGGIVAIEEREVPLKPASGDRLQIRVHDGDSPALTSPVFTAVIARPSLLFHSNGGANAATLVFGGGRVRAPRYDVASLRSRERLQAGKIAVRATLGEIRDNPAWRDTPALGFAQRAGATADRRRYSHSRALRVAPSDAGLSRLRLGFRDAAVARPDLADLRVVDASNKQWPFLLDASTDHEWVPLPRVEPYRVGRRSVYQLTLPVTPFTPDQLEIDSSVEFFDRLVTVRAQDEEGAERVLRSQLMRRRAEDPRPVILPLSPLRLTSLSIEVEDGDDAPLPLDVRVRVPVHDLYVVAPVGDYTLLLGDPSAEPPQYELASVRAVVLASPSSEIDGAALEANPRFRPRSRFSGADGLQAGVWAVLLLAIGVLFALTVRLVRSEPVADDPAPPAPPTDPPTAATPPATPA